MRRIVIRLVLGLLALLIVGGAGVTALLWWQAQRTSDAAPDYVALGSSFAAGIGIGARASGSPWICMRTMGGYPSVLARMRGLPLVDNSCSGATARQMVAGGRAFLKPQVDAVGRGTRLVTITAGGNDIGYVGDLSLMAARRAPGFKGWIVRLLSQAPDAQADRDYEAVHAALLVTMREVRRRSPDAAIVLASYPRILPDAGSCDKLGLTAKEVAAMRGVADRLAQVSAHAAQDGGALFVDMHAGGAGHDACAKEPWVNGWSVGGTPFHPNAAGARAVAVAIDRALDAGSLSR